MDELAELGHGLDEVAADELAHPLGRLLAHLRLELDLEDAVREQLLVLVGQLGEGPVDADVGPAPVVARPLAPVPVVLAHERQLRVERDAHARVAGELERRAVVEGADDCERERKRESGAARTSSSSAGFSAAAPPAAEREHQGRTRAELLVLDGRLHLARELDHRVDLLVALLALLAQLLERLVHRVSPGDEVVDEVLGDREPRLDRLLARPVLAVRLALDLFREDDEDQLMREGDDSGRESGDAQRSA